MQRRNAAVTLPRAQRALGLATSLLLLSACGHATVRFQSADRDNPGRVAGYLVRPASAGPFPAVVLLHAFEGARGNEHTWGRWLAEQGYVSMIIVSERPEGQVGPRIMAGDALGALNHLRSLPFVDGDRVGVMGFSYGANAVLNAVTGFRDYPPVAPGFRAAVAFYPACPPRIEYHEVPLLLLLPQQDDIHPVQPCLEMSRRLERAGRASVVSVVFPNAHHAFDNADVPGLYRWRHGTIMFDPSAAADARVRIRAFLAEHLRPAR